MAAINAGALLANRLFASQAQSRKCVGGKRIPAESRRHAARFGRRSNPSFGGPEQAASQCQGPSDAWMNPNNRVPARRRPAGLMINVTDSPSSLLQARFGPNDFPQALVQVFLVGRHIADAAKIIPRAI